MEGEEKVMPFNRRVRLRRKASKGNETKDTANVMSVSSWEALRRRRMMRHLHLRCKRAITAEMRARITGRKETSDDQEESEKQHPFGPLLAPFPLGWMDRNCDDLPEAATTVLERDFCSKLLQLDTFTLVSLSSAEFLFHVSPLCFFPIPLSSSTEDRFSAQTRLRSSLLPLAIYMTSKPTDPERTATKDPEEEVAETSDPDPDPDM